MAKKKIWEFPENINPQPNLVFLVDENFTTQKLSLSGLTGSDYFSQFLAPVSSGIYNPNNGCIVFTTTSGASFNVCGFSNGAVTGFTYDDKNNLTILRNGEPNLTVNMTKFTGLTVNGIVSATTYYGSALNLTGIVNSGTYDNNTKLITFYRNDGPAAYTVNLSTLDINDTYVTGGTLTLPTNNTNSGFINLSYSQDIADGTYKLPYNDTFITGFTYNNSNTFTIVDNNNGKFSATINSVTGLTVNGNLTTNGNLTVTGSTSLSTTTTGNLTVNGTTTLSGVTNHIGNVNITGSTSLNGNLTVKNSNGTNTGTVLLNTTQISNGSTITASVQNKNGTIAYLSDISSGEPNAKGYVFMENNAVATVCTVANTYYKISGTTSTIPGYLSLFTTGSSSNQLVHNLPSATGTSFTYLKYSISMSLQSTAGGGGGRTVNVQLRKNGSPVPITITTQTQGNNTPTPITLSGIVTALNNDSFEVYLNCTSSTTNITVTDLTVSLFV